MRCCTELLILLQRGIEHGGALIHGQRLSKVLARPSGLKGIAEPFVVGQCSFEQRPRTGRVTLPEVQQPVSAIDGRPQDGDSLADAVGLGQKRPKFFGIMKGDESVHHEHCLEWRLFIGQASLRREDLLGLIAGARRIASSQQGEPMERFR